MIKCKTIYTIKWEEYLNYYYKTEWKIINKKVVKFLKYRSFFSYKKLLSQTFWKCLLFAFKLSFFLFFLQLRHIYMECTTKGNCTLEIQTWYKEWKRNSFHSSRFWRKFEGRTRKFIYVDFVWRRRTWRNDKEWK